MKTKLLTIAMTAALILAAITKGQAQQFDGPCLPSAHGLSGHQSAFCGSILTQTIALSSTTVNYCSFYVDITLADLQTALTDALGTGNNVSIMIKSKEQNCKLTRGRWIGQLSTLDLGKMYKITVNSDCEITLEGMPVDPAEHSVNISGQGVATWIAFPFNTSMTVTDAFAGFAVNNDVVKSKAQNASYTRGRWNGALQTLEPGQGYIYKSAATGNRTFTFPTSAK